MPPRLSIIMPVLDEAAGLAQTLSLLAPFRAQGVEVVVVDGGSRDASVAIAGESCDKLVRSERGRARQMNAGTEAATGRLLLFLHADTRLPDDALQQIEQGIAATGRHWGRFDIRLSGAHPMLRVVEWSMNHRSRWTRIMTGDQAMFVSREYFSAVGGFPDLALMEDLAISRRLKRQGRPLCLTGPVVSSSRRWEEGGILRTILLMWRLRLAWFLGASPEALARRYR
jgi:rSAM/selenodomain-associated transferase 2